MTRDDLSGLYPRGVRTAVALGVLLALAAPAAAVGEQGSLTLRAPRATTFGHVVDLTRAGLAGQARYAREPVRGITPVAATAARRDGS